MMYIVPNTVTGHETHKLMYVNVLRLTTSVISWLTYSKKQYPFENVVPLSLTRLKARKSPNDESNSFTCEKNCRHTINDYEREWIWTY